MGTYLSMNEGIGEKSATYDRRVVGLVMIGGGGSC